MKTDPVKVLMVCLGNICRSPTAEGIFRAQVQKARLQEYVLVDSAGTSDWHVGEPPDPRTVKAAAQRSYDLSEQRARQVQHQDFSEFDYVLAMDRQNLRELQRRCPEQYQGKLGLFLQHGNSAEKEVPDPYDGDANGFELVLDLVEDASAGLLNNLLTKHNFPR